MAAPRCSATRTRPIPSCGRATSLVRVRACALNHLDLWNRRGVVKLPLPHISGADVAGEIVDVARSGRYRVGRRVMLQPGLSCGHCEACLSGRDNFCPRYDVLGFAKRRRLRRVGARAAPERHSDSRRDRVRRSRGVSADVPHGLAHADHARRPALGRGRARARRRQRRRTGGDSDRPAPRRARVCHGGHRREAGARARDGRRPKSSIITRRTSPPRSAASPAIAASTSSSSTSARRRGTAA